MCVMIIFFSQLQKKRIEVPDLHLPFGYFYFPTHTRAFESLSFPLFRMTKEQWSERTKRQQQQK